MQPSSPGPKPSGSPPEAALEIIGVLGGIASGKSKVARLLAGSTAEVVSADAIAREVLNSPEVTALVREHWGAAFLGPDGRPDRERLAREVFGPGEGAGKRRELESWTHPRVRARILERLREARARGIRRLVLDVPLLLENDAQHGLAGLCTALVFVDARDEVREERARQTRAWTPGEVARREAVQLPLEEKRKRADYVIPNNGTLEELERVVAEVFDAMTDEGGPPR